MAAQHVGKGVLPVRTDADTAGSPDCQQLPALPSSSDTACQDDDR
jgi:hypothetical protein